MKKYIDPIHYKTPTNFHDQISADRDDIIRQHLGKNSTWNIIMVTFLLIFLVFVTYHVGLYFMNR